MLTLGFIIVAILLVGAIGLAVAMLGGTWFATQLFPPSEDPPKPSTDR